MDGKLGRIIRLDRAPRVPTKEDQDAYIAWLSSDRKSGNQPQPQFEKHFPAIDRLLVGAGGEVWVGEGGPRTPETAKIWIVIGPDGRYSGMVVTPPGLTLASVGRDYVLGYRSGADGEPIIQMHSLERGR
jgi:hypothetical protein